MPGWPHISATVTVPGKPGKWTVWAAHPERSTWWLMPYDKDAHGYIAEHPDSTTNSCIAVKRNDMKPLPVMDRKFG